MAKIVYVQLDGTRNEIDAGAAASVMQAAVNNDVPGIIGECGGSAMCATCHVYVDEQDAGKFPPISPPEQEMLECTTSPLKPNSRLGCQLVVADDARITVYLPETQQ